MRDTTHPKAIVQTQAQRAAVSVISKGVVVA